MKHPPALVARIKGLVQAGLKPKAAASMAGISLHTIREWLGGKSCAEIPADPIAKHLLEDTLKIAGDKN